MVSNSGTRTNNSKPFNSVFTTTYAAYGTQSLMQILAQTAAAGSNDELAKYVIAALLNARTSKTNCIVDEFTVQTIWSRCSTGSFFEPTAGIQWTASTSNSAGSPGGCIAWLKSTMV